MAPRPSSLDPAAGRDARSGTCGALAAGRRRRTVRPALVALAVAAPGWPVTARAQTAPPADSAARAAAAAAPNAPATPNAAGPNAAAAGAASDTSCARPRPILRPGSARPRCFPAVEVFGDGNVKDVLGGQTGTAAASGALGLHFIGPRYDVTGLVNVAGTNDTVRSRYGTVRSPYGAAILVPAAGTALNAASLSIRRRFRTWGDPVCTREDPTKWCSLGLRIHADAATRLWATRTQRVAAPAAAGATDAQAAAAAGDSVDRVLEARDVPTWGAGVNLSYTFFQNALTADDGTARPLQMVLDLGYARRSLRGDLTSPGRAALRDSLIGTRRQKNFDGFEIGLTMQYNQVRSSFTYVLLNGGVDGLSRGQIVALVDLRAVLASGLLRR